MARRNASAEKLEHRARGARLGFRVDRSTKAMVERAAYLERRSVTDFCLTALGDAAQKSIARHETLVLSERDRAVFFDALIHPPKSPSRLKRAVKAERERIER
jgi:uncharacterized protein (DUF1778 family)